MAIAIDFGVRRISGILKRFFTITRSDHYLGYFSNINKKLIDCHDPVTKPCFEREVDSDDFGNMSKVEDLIKRVDKMPSTPNLVFAGVAIAVCVSTIFCLILIS